IPEPVVRQQFARIRHRLAKHKSAVQAAAAVISRSPSSGLRLLRDSRTADHTQPQPDVYPFAAYLAEQFDCTHAVLLGHPTAKDLIQLYPQFAIVGFVSE